MCAALAACVPVPEAEESATELITTATLSRGLAVAAPDGFCVDTSSLSRDFALMARCDRLSARGARSNAPLAVITVTAPSFDGQTALPEPQALVGETEALLDSHRTGDLQLVKVAGNPPAEGLSGRYWRGAGLVGRRFMGVAIYPKANARSLDQDAIVLLKETFERSADLSRSGPASAETRVEEPTEDAEDAPEKPRRGILARLFN